MYSQPYHGKKSKDQSYSSVCANNLRFVLIWKPVRYKIYYLETILKNKGDNLKITCI